MDRIPDGWKRTNLQNLIDIKHGFPFKSEFFREKGDYILLTPGSFYETGGFRDQGSKTKYYEGEIPCEYLLSKNNLLIAMTEQAAGLLGSSLFVPENNKYLHNQRLGLVKIKADNNICSEFLYLTYNSPEVRKQISEQSAGTKVKHTSPDKLKSIVFLLPPLTEQKAIADILSTWDEAIEKTQQLIKAKEKRFKSLLHSLLREKKNWKKVALGEICDITTGKKDVNESNPKGQYPFFTCSKDHTFSDTYSFDITAIIIAGNGNIGNPKLFSGKFEAYQRTYVLFGFKNFSPFYLMLYLTAKLPQSIKQEKQEGAMPYIKVNTLKQFKICYPSFEEQKQIASILNTAQEEINLLKSLLKKYKLQKRGLMQKLLIGTWRVKKDVVKKYKEVK